MTYNPDWGTGGGITELTGDVTASGEGSVVATVATDAVTNAKLADMAAGTLKGNNTGGAANPSDLTAAQVKTLLAIAAGDVSGLGTLATQNGTFSGTSSGTNTGDQTLYNQTVEDEGTPLTQRGTLNFVGAGVAVTDAGGKTTVTIAGASGTGDVVGPASSTDHAVARFDLATGKLLQDSVVLIGDGGLMSGFSQLEANPGADPKYTFVAYTTTGLFFDDSAETIGLAYLGTNVLYYDNASGGIVSPSLAGSGSRMVVADATGTLSTTAIPSGTVSSASIAFTDGDTARRTTIADAAVTSTSKILLSVTRPTVADVDDKGFLYTANVVSRGVGTFDVFTICTDIGGDDPVLSPPNETITLYYTVAN